MTPIPGTSINFILPPTPPTAPIQSTVSAYLSLAPALVSSILAIESLFPAPKSGPSKLQTFINLSLGIFAVGGPLAAAGIDGSHDPQTITNLATLFAGVVVQGINQSRSINQQTIQDPTVNQQIKIQNSALGGASPIAS